jgi:hypothetical protein
MNKLLASPLDLRKTKKIYWLALILFCALPVLLNTLIIVPIYSSLQTDVVYQDSAITVIIKYAQDMLDLCSFSVAYATIIFSTLELSASFTRLSVIFYSILFFVQIPLKLLINAFIYGSLGTGAQITVDLIYLSVYFVLQMIQLLAVYAFAKNDSNKYRIYVESLGSKKGDASSKIQKILPLEKFLNWNNPLQRSAIKMSLLILSIKIFARIVNDITYGAPESVGEVLIMFVYYASDLLYGIIAYIIAIFAISLIYDLSKKKDADNSTS